MNEDNREKRRLLNQSLKTELDMLLMIKKQQRQKTWMIKDAELGISAGNRYTKRVNVQLSVRLEAEESIIRTRIEMINEQMKQVELECLDLSNQVLSETEEEIEVIEGKMETVMEVVRTEENTGDSEMISESMSHLEIPPIPAPRSKNSSRSVSPNKTTEPTQEELDEKSRLLCEELGYPVEFI